MDGETKLLDRLLATETKAELLALFHRNPGLVDTVDAVARRIGRTGDEVDGDVRDLVDIGILQVKRVGNQKAIMLNRARDRQIQDSLKAHFKGLGGKNL